MSYADDLETLIQDEPQEVQAALRRAIQFLEEDDGPEPDEAIHTLTKLGAIAASGAMPGGALITEGILALLTIGRTIRKKRQEKIQRLKKSTISAGLSAHISSRVTSSMENSKRAAAAQERARRSPNFKKELP